MPTTVTSLAEYKDPQGNEIHYNGTYMVPDVAISFGGHGNRLIVNEGARLRKISAEFRGSNAEIVIAACSTSLIILLGSEARISIGSDTTSTGTIYMTAFEGSSISIGNDCMFASGVQIRADDAHPIFDIESGKRLNRSRSVLIGDHAWLGEGCVLLNGSEIGPGSIIGTRSVLKKKIPNNCVAVGIPARITRRNVAWERPHLSQENLFTPQGDLKDHHERTYWRPTED